MPRANLGLMVAGCAATAIGALSGWMALALLPRQAPGLEPPVQTVSSAPVAVPTPASADEAPAPAPTPAPAATAPAPPKPVATGPLGVWIDHTGRGAVEIKECASGLCGRIVWLKDAGQKSACGTYVIGNAKPVSGGAWGGGWIYDPEKNARYDVELKPIGADRLRVVGYLGTKMFSETFTWKRAAPDLERCDAPAPSPAPAVVADGKPAPTEVTKAEPASTPAPEPATPPGKRPANPGIADLEKVAREVIKRKPGGKGCRATLPYVGTIDVPCAG
jgi:uncharacterized protein (DUF2147 family)